MNKKSYTRCHVLSIYSKCNWIIRRLDRIGILHTSLLAHLVHNIHNDDALRQRLVLPFFSTFLDSKSTLIGWKRTVSEPNLDI